MRDYLIKVLAVMLLSSLGEMFLPEGSIRKYAAVLLSLPVCCALLAPLGTNNLRFDVPQVEVNDTFNDTVLKQYKEKAEKYVEEKTGTQAELTIDKSGIITHMCLSTSPVCGTEILEQELGVKQSEIEISSK